VATSLPSSSAIAANLIDLSSEITLSQNSWKNGFIQPLSKA